VQGAESSKPELHAVGAPAAGDPAAGDPAASADKYRTLSVIVPVFNERNTIAEILRRIRAVELPMHLEVVVVDDGSTDGTGKVLSALQDSTVRVVTHHANRGKGAAVRTGIETARGQLVLIQDGDLEYDPDDWPTLLEPVLKGKAQVVYGSRFTGAGRAMRPTQWLGNRLLTLTANVLYRSTLSDMETCYKLFDRRVLTGMVLVSNRFDFEPEITAKVLRRGYRIYEVPISYTGRDASEGTKFEWRDGVRALTALVRYRFVRHI
jgi:glycosyltransferase involved in cell wall biosynthesis